MPIVISTHASSPTCRAHAYTAKNVQACEDPSVKGVCKWKNSCPDDPNAPGANYKLYAEGVSCGGKDPADLNDDVLCMIRKSRPRC